MDNMAAGWERPMEDEFALQNCGEPTPYLATMFPNRGAVYQEYLSLRDLSCEQRHRWKQSLRRFCARLTKLDRRRLVLKSPTHTARIRTLLEIFPDAKFIHVSREPYAMFRSTVDLWRTLNLEVGLQFVQNDDWLEPYVIDTHRIMYDAYFVDRPLLDSRQLVELKYEDLVRDPIRHLRTCYEQLDLGVFSMAEPSFEEHLAQVGNYQSNPHLVDDGVRKVIEQEWSEYAHRFSYRPLDEMAKAA